MKVTITGSAKVFSAEPTRQGKVDRLVTYKTDDPADVGKPLFVTVPDETATDATIQAAIRDEERRRRAATPQSFEV